MKLPCLPDAWFAVLKGVLPRMPPRRAPLQAQGGVGCPDGMMRLYVSYFCHGTRSWRELRFLKAGFLRGRTEAYSFLAGGVS